MSESIIRDFITNKIEFDIENKPYCVMIGITPSTGARSPMLWNHTLKVLNQEQRTLLKQL